jgi:hypothetical protein
MPKRLNKVNATETLKAVTNAVMSGESPSLAAQKEGMSKANAQLLSRVLQTDIAEWREKTKEKLIKMSDKMLDHIDENMHEIPASGWMFAYSVLRDSVSSMDSKTAPGAANVNIQVNNYGSDATAKAKMIDALHGIIPLEDQKPVIEVISPTPQPQRAAEPQ